jgi:hypothetical protein
MYRKFFHDLSAMRRQARGLKPRQPAELLFPTRVRDDLPDFLHILANAGNGVAAGQGDDGQGGNDQSDGGFHDVLVRG